MISYVRVTEENMTNCENSLVNKPWVIISQKQGHANSKCFTVYDEWADSNIKDRSIVPKFEVS